MLIIKLKKNIFKNTYSIVLSKKKQLNNLADPVVEKIGSVSLNNNKVSINAFRLAFWLSKNVYCTGNVVNILFQLGVFNDI